MAFDGAARATCRGGPPVVPNNTILVRDDCAATGLRASADAKITPAGIFSVSRLDKDMDDPSRYVRRSRVALNLEAMTYKICLASFCGVQRPAIRYDG